MSARHHRERHYGRMKRERERENRPLTATHTHAKNNHLGAGAMSTPNLVAEMIARLEREQTEWRRELHASVEGRTRTTRDWQRERRRLMRWMRWAPQYGPASNRELPRVKERETCTLYTTDLIAASLAAIALRRPSLGRTDVTSAPYSAPT